MSPLQRLQKHHGKENLQALFPLKARPGTAANQNTIHGILIVKVSNPGRSSWLLWDLVGQGRSLEEGEEE
jgi:hypothetical protein